MQGIPGGSLPFPRARTPRGNFALDFAAIHLVEVGKGIFGPIRPKSPGCSPPPPDMWKILPVSLASRHVVILRSSTSTLPLLRLFPAASASSEIILLRDLLRSALQPPPPSGATNSTYLLRPPPQEATHAASPCSLHLLPRSRSHVSGVDLHLATYSTSLRIYTCPRLPAIAEQIRCLLTMESVPSLYPIFSLYF